MSAFTRKALLQSFCPLASMALPSIAASAALALTHATHSSSTSKLSAHHLATMKPAKAPPVRKWLLRSLTLGCVPNHWNFKSNVRSLSCNMCY